MKTRADEFCAPLTSAEFANTARRHSSHRNGNSEIAVRARDAYSKMRGLARELEQRAHSSCEKIRIFEAEYNSQLAEFRRQAEAGLVNCDLLLRAVPGRGRAKGKGMGPAPGGAWSALESHISELEEERDALEAILEKESSTIQKIYRGMDPSTAKPYVTEVKAAFAPEESAPLGRVVMRLNLYLGEKRQELGEIRKKSQEQTMAHAGLCDGRRRRGGRGGPPSAGGDNQYEVPPSAGAKRPSAPVGAKVEQKSPPSKKQ